MVLLVTMLVTTITITKLPVSGVLCGNIAEFALQAQVILLHPKQSDIATQHTRAGLR